MNKKIELFLTFLKIGATTFGGGYAMIPQIKNEFECKKREKLSMNLQES